MAQIEVLRYPSEKDWTLSEFLICGKLFGYGVEDEYREVKVHGETRIPNGVYELELTHSPKFSSSYYVSKKTGELSKLQSDDFNEAHKLITLKNVPGFERILWHWGNTDDDSRGCYIVGSEIGIIKGQKGVLGSRKKYEQIYPMIASLIKTNQSKGIKTFIEYRDKYPQIKAIV